ncbi:SGNH/GDSL hydrolase family protein [Streptomyces sp. NPDC060243]|uniref:SGNH/GDSL hydrolase family protein n=1 Tax=Streptomyces sp. NPDC060243 TaxID=3347081 RepID=UPI003665446D
MDVLTPLTLAADPDGPRAAAPTRYVDRWRLRDLPDPATVDALYGGSAPTITVTQTSTPTSGYVLYRPPGVTLTGTDVAGAFTMLGAGEFAIGTGTPDSTYVLPTSRYPHTRGTLTSSQSTWALEFATDAATMQVRVNYQTASAYRLYLDGRKLADAMTPLGGSTAGNTHMMTVAFGSAVPRIVRLDVSTMPFGGVYLPSTGGLWSTVAQGGRLMAFGDSLTDGSNQNAGGGAGTWFYRAGRLLGSSDLWEQARGGTGYITPGSYATLPDRVAADVIAYKPDRLIIWAGYNDNQGSQSAIGSAAAGMYAQIKASLPACEVFVIGCWCPTATAATSIVNTDATLRVAAVGAGFPFVSPVTGSVYGADGGLVGSQGPWITSGNAAGYVGADGVHPTEAGHVYLSRRITTAIRQTMPA